MDLVSACTYLGIALALGLLVGLQRERSHSGVAGIRTFAFIALLGALMPVLAGLMAVAWALPVLVGCGLLGVLGLAYIGNMARSGPGQMAGVTTEVAMLVMFCGGVLCGAGEPRLAAIIGAVTVVLLHLKPSLQRFTAALTDEDVRAVMQFTVITLIILPVVPDRDMGPFDAFNPRKMWMLVVLVVGISLAAYVAYRVLGARAGALLSGVLGGLISSTATAASFARRVREQPASAALACGVIFIATTVLYVRVLVELYAVARASFPLLVWPLAALLGVCGVTAAAGAFAASRGVQGQLAPAKNPSELKSALLFAGLFAVVQLLSAAANHWVGAGGQYAVAAVAGLTDLDAITLSSGRLLTQGRMSPSQAGTAIVIALGANLVFKTCMAGVLAGPALVRRMWWMTGVNLGACVLVGALWMPRVASLAAPAVGFSGPGGGVVAHSHR
ncbi:MAG: MgtC/SapB family protein [Phycisphaerales bacterium]